MAVQEEQGQRGENHGGRSGAKTAKTAAKPKSNGRRARETEGAAEVLVCKKAKVPVTSTEGFNMLFGPARQALATGTAGPREQH
eukprot:10637965-Heterocapsa_arctica.AAC.1